MKQYVKEENYTKKQKIELFNDHFQNYKRYGIPKAQLVIADIPYNLGVNAYASSTEWYIDGDNKNGESKKAGKSFFDTDNSFNLVEYFNFCSKLLIKEPKERGKAPAMIIFCSFQQMPIWISQFIPYIFYKKLFSTSVKSEYENSRSSRTRHYIIS
jgi:site-specific DNA-methyltransferase (adenine-specific)